MNKKYKIALLYGGISSEREISLMSGNNVSKALMESGHDVTLIDTKDKNQLKKLISEKFDVAYIALHGKGGEDGSIQGFLETLCIPYTGSKVYSSSCSINKANTKIIYEKAGIPTAPYFVINSNNLYELSRLLDITGEDVVVKAASEGSSIGLYFANGNLVIKESIEKAFEFDKEIVVEKNIKGREFTVAVLELSNNVYNDSDQIVCRNKNVALPVIEIIPKNKFYDFASKYDEGGSQHICPAQIDKELTKKLQNCALDAHIALKCSGFSRTDFRVDELKNIFALETNTIPGMTEKSLVPDAAKVIGISFKELCNLIICSVFH